MSSAPWEHGWPEPTAAALTAAGWEQREDGWHADPDHEDPAAVHVDRLWYGVDGPTPSRHVWVSCSCTPRWRNSTGADLDDSPTLHPSRRHGKQVPRLVRWWNKHEACAAAGGVHDPGSLDGAGAPAPSAQLALFSLDGDDLDDEADWPDDDDEEWHEPRVETVAEL